jgi:hypothetical protein
LLEGFELRLQRRNDADLAHGVDDAIDFAA